MSPGCGDDQCFLGKDESPYDLGSPYDQCFLGRGESPCNLGFHIWGTKGRHILLMGSNSGIKLEESTERTHTLEIRI